MPAVIIYCLTLFYLSLSELCNIASTNMLFDSKVRLGTYINSVSFQELSEVLSLPLLCKAYIAIFKYNMLFL